MTNGPWSNAHAKRARGSSLFALRRRLGAARMRRLDCIVGGQTVWLVCWSAKAGRGPYATARRSTFLRLSRRLMKMQPEEHAVEYPVDQDSRVDSTRSFIAVAHRHRQCE